MKPMGEAELRDSADEFEDAATADFVERYGVAPL
ncbi:hypothetical protein QE392_003155 [Microbacterium proteolyticum]|nr:hypothetical protein [Microbacterium sp. SORGH_AS_0344]MDQ1171351.1 hypothetical protein [Microbacterium proteolyticum]